MKMQQYIIANYTGLYGRIFYPRMNRYAFLVFAKIFHITEDNFIFFKTGGRYDVKIQLSSLFQTKEIELLRQELKEKIQINTMLKFRFPLRTPHFDKIDIFFYREFAKRVRIFSFLTRSRLNLMYNTVRKPLISLPFFLSLRTQKNSAIISFTGDDEFDRASFSSLYRFRRFKFGGYLVTLPFHNKPRSTILSINNNIVFISYRFRQYGFDLISQFLLHQRSIKLPEFYRFRIVRFHKFFKLLIFTLRSLQKVKINMIKSFQNFIVNENYSNKFNEIILNYILSLYSLFVNKYRKMIITWIKRLYRYHFFKNLSYKRKLVLCVFEGVLHTLRYNYSPQMTKKLQEKRKWKKHLKKHLSFIFRRKFKKHLKYRKEIYKTRKKIKGILKYINKRKKKYRVSYQKRQRKYRPLWLRFRKMLSVGLLKRRLLVSLIVNL